MPPRSARDSFSLLALLLLLPATACGDRGRGESDSTSLGATPNTTAPVNTTNWDAEAGPLMVAAHGEGDTVAIVLPQATDSTIAPDDESIAPVSDLVVDLLGRSGRIASGAIVSPLPRIGRVGECRAWPSGQVKNSRPGWRVGFTSGLVTAVPLDSIDAMSSVDSSALAAAISESVATIPAVSDPMFRGLRFRVRSAYTFRTDSIEVLVADVVRSVNEEANPRLEHLFLIGERPVRSSAKYRVAFYNRTAGAEEAAEVTELLAVATIGPQKRPAIVVNVEYDEGGNLGILERTSSGQWQFRWRSAYTGC